MREINPPSREDIERIAAEQGVSMPSAQSAPSASAASQQKPVSQPATSQPAASQPVVSDTSRKPVSKIITIGDVQIKYDGN